MKKGFVNNPFLPSSIGQNKTLKLHQNNVVINKTKTQRPSQLLKPFGNACFPPVSSWLEQRILPRKLTTSPPNPKNRGSIFASVKKTEPSLFITESMK